MFVDNRNKNESESTADSVVHYVPFKVEYDGKGNVSTKFTSKTVQVDGQQDHNSHEGSLENQFRGKPLTGKVLQLPSHYEGIVATDLSRSTSKMNSDDSTKDISLHVVKGFNSVTYWNWDRPPTGMDAPVKLLDWLNLSQVLHDPIEDNS